MTQAIPASQIVNVIPGVESAGGSALDLSGLILTFNTRVPIGTVMSFPTPASVASFFGGTSIEANLANVYFQGFLNSTVKPGAVLFAQYPWTAPVGAYLRGGPITLAQINAITSGTLVVVSNGTTFTSTALNLGSAASPSAAATTIQSAFTSPTFTVAYDSVSGGFVFTSTTTGSASAISFATGANSAPLMLTAATGAVISQGSPLAVPATFMNNIVAQTQNFATFMTAFEPVTADKIAFSAWNNASSPIDRYVYMMWSTDVTDTTNSNTASATYAITAAGYSGTEPIYAPVNTCYAAAFRCGAVASIDFTAVNGRTSSAFKTQSGLAADVTSAMVASNLDANNLNFIGSYSTANDNFVFYYPGSITGPFAWSDSYVNQIWLNNGFQLAGMELLTQVKSIPYTAVGDTYISAAFQDPISAALSFGAIQPGVTLSALQTAEVNAACGGKNVATTIQNRGWYLYLPPTAPQVRAVRGPRQATFFYTDGQSVNSISLSSIEVV